MRMRTLGHRIAAMLSITLMLAGCGHLTSPRPSPRGEGGACRTLTGIDSLMWQQPDSAFALLLDFAESPEADCLDVFNGHYFQLLVAELLYKNDYVQSNRPGLLQAVAYFDSLTSIPNERTRLQHLMAGTDPPSPTRDDLVFLAARAHYINGVGYYERDSVVEACAEYLKTLEIMEGNFEEKELIGHKAQFMTYTFNRLGDLFSEQLMMESSIKCYDNALVFCKIKPTSPQGLANILSRIGLQYDKLGDKEKMMYYYEQALKEMPAEENSNYRDLKAIIALCDYQLGSGIEKPMKTLMEVLDKAEDESECLSRYLTIGDIYYEEGVFDSALYYLNPAFEKQENVALRVQVAGFLHDIYSAQGDVENADKYARYIAGYKTIVGENMVVVSKLEGLYQDYLHQKQEKQAEEALETSVKKTVGIIIPIAVAVALVVLVLSKLKSRKILREQQEKADRMYGDKERSHRQEMESMRQTHKMQQAALSGRLRRSNEELRDVSNRLEQMLAKDALSESELSDDYCAFVNAPVCLYIVELTHKQQFKSKMDYLVYKSYALNRDQLLALRNAAKQNLPRFISNIHKQYPGLTDSDMDYCCLILLGLNEADISVLLQKAYTTVCDRCRKISRIIGTTGSLYHTLHSMLSV